ncbi:MAG: 50S ribosomal protein L9 [Anaerolineaceae bacterium]|nr:50S ribosomal protein L9 [Anaerolineaceae bacterium]
MKVLLIKDVYKLGHAGDVKRVADGYGRNFLLPQGLALLATPGALKQSETIRAHANVRRAELNTEMGSVADRLKDVVITFASKAGETGKLYGSITPQMIAEAIRQATGVEVDRRQIDVQPIRNLGDHKARVRLTVDLIPEVKVIVYREGEVKPGSTAPKPVISEAKTETPAVEQIIEQPVETETTQAAEEQAG